ncbi:MAG: helix-turn-helix transcriptional regulator [Ardenticatenaceae bacterium]
MKDGERVIFESRIGQIGVFRNGPYSAAFRGTARIHGAYLVVFPRTSVCITHAGLEPVIADPNVVMFYNDGQLYRRSRVSERGDLCEWFGFPPGVIRETLSSYDPPATEREVELFQLTHGPSNPHVYLVQRLIVEHILATDCIDSLYVEEAMLYVLHKVLEHVYQAHGWRPRQSTSQTQRTHRELAEESKQILVTRFHESLSLEQLASELYCSPFHLSRVFRQQTGSTIHRYLNQLRLRTALEQLAEGESTLAKVAVSLGYASHSHFTQAFSQSFGLTPSHLQRAFLRQFPKVSKILTV